MELMEAIRARKSYRNEFYNTPVPRSDLREILEGWGWPLRPAAICRPPS